MKELVDFGDLPIVYPNWPLATTQTYLEKNRDAALRFLRAYCQGIQRVKEDRETTLKIFAKYTKVQEPDTLAELYRIYAINHLEKIPYAKPEAVEEALRSEAKTNEAARAADFIDNSLVAELERNGFFRRLYHQEEAWVIAISENG